MNTSDDSAHLAAATSNDLLIDRYLPTFDVTIVEHVVVDADAATTWQALCDLDLTRVHTPLLDAAFFLRDLPSRAASWMGRATSAPPPPQELKLLGDTSPIAGWLSLGHTPRRELVLGAVGRFWQPDIEWYDVSAMTPEEFAAFHEPGWGRIAANFSLLPYGATRTLVSYEARTATADPEAAQKFARYWRVVRPFAGHVMRAALADVRSNATAAAHGSVDAAAGREASTVSQQWP